jgi:hypothetical protein
MHILGAIFFLATLILALGAIGALLIGNRDRIIGALLGDAVAPVDCGTVVQMAPRHAARVKTALPSNDGFSLPLAA